MKRVTIKGLVKDKTYSLPDGDTHIRWISEYPDVYQYTIIWWSPGAPINKTHFAYIIMNREILRGNAIYIFVQDRYVNIIHDEFIMLSDLTDLNNFVTALMPALERNKDKLI